MLNCYQCICLHFSNYYFMERNEVRIAVVKAFILSINSEQCGCIQCFQAWKIPFAVAFGPDTRPRHGLCPWMVAVSSVNSGWVWVSRRGVCTCVSSVCAKLASCIIWLCFLWCLVTLLVSLWGWARLTVTNLHLKVLKSNHMCALLGGQGSSGDSLEP